MWQCQIGCRRRGILDIRLYRKFWIVGLHWKKKISEFGLSPLMRMTARYFKQKAAIFLKTIFDLYINLYV